MRKLPWLVTPAALATTFAGGLTAFMATQVTRVRRSPRYTQTLLAVEGEYVTLERDAGTQRVGTYGLAWSGGHAVLGEVSEGTASTVVRPVIRVDYGTLAPGKVALDHVEIGDPGRAFGYEFQEISLESDVGSIPAWQLNGEGDSWVILVHGYGGRRASSLSFLPLLHERGLNILVPAYRNDADAPPSADHRYHLGATEWRDLEAALDHAIEQGARQVIVYGWSMGGAIALQAAARSVHRGAITALILDSPVVDWRDVLLNVTDRNHIPAPLAHLAFALIERQIDIDFDDLDWVQRSDELDIPMLIVTGDDDRTVPHARSLELAGARPDLVTLLVVEGAGHVGSWNVDPARYAEALNGFLDRSLEAVSH